MMPVKNMIIFCLDVHQANKSHLMGRQLNLKSVKSLIQWMQELGLPPFARVISMSIFQIKYHLLAHKQ